VIFALVWTAINWRAPAPLMRKHYLGAWLIGAIIFAAILRWNPWQVRYHLPAFMLASPLFATVAPERWSNSRIATTLCLFLGLTALPVLLLNQSRELLPLARDRPFPLLRDRPSYLTQTPYERLFVNQQRLLGNYKDAVDIIVRSKASNVGLVLGNDSWEYPIWRMLRDRKLGYFVRIEHVGLPDPHWPLGPFSPDVVFWSDGDAPSALTIEGQDFTRIGPSETVTVFRRKE
jgi:hypothetical protein